MIGELEVYHASRTTNRMFCTTSETEDEVGAVKSIFSPPVVFYITDCTNVVLLIWFSVFACFGVSPYTVFTFCVSR